MTTEDKKDALIKTLAEALKPLAALRKNRPHDSEENLFLQFSLKMGDIAKAKVAMEEYERSKIHQEAGIVAKLIAFYKDAENNNLAPSITFRTDKLTIIKALEHYHATLAQEYGVG